MPHRDANIDPTKSLNFVIIEAKQKKINAVVTSSKQDTHSFSSFAYLHFKDKINSAYYDTFLAVLLIPPVSLNKFLKALSNAKSTLLSLPPA